MSFKKWFPLVLLLVIAIIPCLPGVYNSKILGFTGSTMMALVGFFAVSIVLGIHQWLHEKGD